MKLMVSHSEKSLESGRSIAELMIEEEKTQSDVKANLNIYFFLRNFLLKSPMILSAELNLKNFWQEHCKLLN